MTCKNNFIGPKKYKYQNYNVRNINIDQTVQLDSDQNMEKQKTDRTQMTMKQKSN